MHIPDQIMFYQGRMFYQQRDSRHRLSGLLRLQTQTWVYHSAGDLWAARYSRELRAIAPG